MEVLRHPKPVDTSPNQAPKSSSKAKTKRSNGDAVIVEPPRPDKPRPTSAAAKLPQGLKNYGKEQKYARDEVAQQYLGTGRGNEVASSSARHERPQTAPAEPRPSSNALNQRRRMSDINKENRRIAERLRAVAREPPAQFHAPNGAKSLKTAPPSDMGTRRMDELPKNHKDQHWPPRAPPLPSAAETHAAAELAKANLRMREKMLRPYAGVCRYKSFADTMGGPPADTERLWAERAEHYRSRRPRSGKALPVWGPPDNDKGVPRCMAVAQCSGCGRKSFWRGDGTRLSPCEHGCGHSFYCSDVCAKLDWEVHRAECRFRAKGIKPTRGAEETWVTNGALARARKLLRKQTLSPEQVYLRYLKWREEELAAEKDMERRIKEDAWGLQDSERPCCTGAVGKVVDPNLAHRRGMHGKVFTATAGNRVLSVRLNSKGTEICERNFGAVKGIVPGVYPA